MTKRIGVVGARGYAGGELLRLLADHDGLTVAHAASRALAGRPVQELEASLAEELTIVAPGPDAAVAAGLDACVLALPNGEAAPYVAAFERAAPETVLVDFSADHRSAVGWAYGLPELNRAALKGARRIANPGCYATAAQLALAPLVDMLAGPASAFGVSGWSGAGTRPSPRNDAARLAESVMPYAVAGHGHEREIRAGLGGAPVNFTPHVAGFFRGLIVTAHAPLTPGATAADVVARFAKAYGSEPLVDVVAEPPEVRDARDTPRAVVGGVTVVEDEGRAVVSCVLDNLLKGAASQALQNLNLALGCPETQGLAAADVAPV